MKALERFKLHLEATGETLAEFIARSGTPRATVYKFFNGQDARLSTWEDGIKPYLSEAALTATQRPELPDEAA